MSRVTIFAWLPSLLLTACSGRDVPVKDRIADMPASQQMAISRRELTNSWPFIPGAGALGCLSGAVVFRADGVSYALNDAARSRGYAPVDPIVLTTPGPPSNPLGRIKQDERMRVFAAADACRIRAQPSVCRQELARAHTLSSDELAQIEVEGRERSWPPLPRHPRDLAPVLQAGMALCREP
jgi:hypothetical protein